MIKNIDFRVVMLVLYRKPGWGPDGEPVAPMLLVPRIATRINGPSWPVVVLYGGDRLKVSQMRGLLGAFDGECSDVWLHQTFVHIDDLPATVIHGHRLWRRSAVTVLRGLISASRQFTVVLVLSAAILIPVVAVLAAREYVGEQATWGAVVGALTVTGMVAAAHFTSNSRW